MDFDWEQFLQPYGSGEMLSVRMYQSFWGRNSVACYPWELFLGFPPRFQIGKGVGHSVEDAMAQAAMALIAFCITPAERRNYIPVPETEEREVHEPEATDYLTGRA